jgi:hypothetical protein
MAWHPQLYQKYLICQKYLMGNNNNDHASTLSSNEKNFVALIVY